MHRLGWVLGSALALAACKGQTLDLGQTQLPSQAPKPIHIVVLPDVDTSAGVGGVFAERMSTSVQPASWQYQFFEVQPDGGALLQSLAPYHLHIQALDLAFPLQEETNSPSDWDASELDLMMPKIRQYAPDPMFQIMPPPFLPSLIQNDIVDTAAADMYAEYCGYLVQYFNLGKVEYPAGSGNWITNPNGPQPIYWWSLLDDIDINGIDGLNYAEIYDEAVGRMNKVIGDAGTLHFASLEYGDPQANLDRLVSDVTGFLGNVSNKPDVVALHLYAASAASSMDSEIFQKVPDMKAAVSAAVGAVAEAGSTAQVWVTQNNVNSQAPGNGKVITVDGRGTSTFFAAYRPYVFSQFGKAGNRALFHWDFTAGNIDGGPNPDMDQQNAEVDYVSGKQYPSYWVDYWLEQMFPVSDGGPPLHILKLETEPDGGSDLASDDVEALAVSNSKDGSVVVMLVDYAPTDDGGSGEPRSFAVDISNLGSFSYGTLLTIDATTVGSLDVDGPKTPVTVSDPKAAISVSLQGYGVAFLQLMPK